MTDCAIQTSHISKRYALGEGRSLLDRSGLMRRFRKQTPSPADATFWALNDVSFEIKRGEAVGIIGHNGAGKSTLLKVLSRITEPSGGHAVIEGRVASLLEVGTGFHPELTGRENIFMNGSILGMRRSEIARNLDQIIEFAGVEKFVDTPVKRYSSGMYVRLAFSVAAHLEPEILIIDEVLAVGDIQFQKKCLGKMDDVSRSGRTVLFVSHNMNAVRQLTTRCILMKRGVVAFDGSSDHAIQAYSEAVEARFEQGADLSEWPRALGDMDRAVEFRTLAFHGRSPVFEPDAEMALEVHVKALDAAAAVRVSGTIFHAEGTAVGSFFSAEALPLAAGEETTVRVSLNGLRLAPGSYTFGLSLTEGNEKLGYRHHDAVMGVLPFDVTGIVGENGTLGTWPHHWGLVRFPEPKMLVLEHGRAT